MDNRGNRLLVSDNDSAINVPAVGAAYAVKKYSAQAPDELSFEVRLYATFLCIFVNTQFFLQICFAFLSLWFIFMFWQ